MATLKPHSAKYDVGMQQRTSQTSKLFGFGVLWHEQLILIVGYSGIHLKLSLLLWLDF